MATFTKSLILDLVAEMKVEEAKTQRVPHYYKRGGKMIERSYPTTIYTDRYKELFFDPEEKLLRSDDAKIFRCERCEEMVGYFDLESWICNFDTDSYTCACCYEEEMGEDL